MAPPLSTYGDLENELSSRINQPIGSGSGLLVSSSEAMGWANMAYYLLCRELALLRDVYTFQFSGVWAEYPIRGSTPNDIIGHDFITIDNGKPLIISNKKFLITENPTIWRTQQGTPEKFYFTDKLYTQIGFDKIPTTASFCQLYYIYRPPFLIDASSVLITPYEMNITIVEYMYFWACVKRGDKWTQDLIALGKPAPSFWNYIIVSREIMNIPDMGTRKFVPFGFEKDVYSV